MRPIRILLALIVGVLVVGGCDAAAHLQALQPPSVPKSPALSVPPAEPAVATHLTGMQRGIDIDFYAYKGEDVELAAQSTVSYIVGLHADATIISFPFFVHGSQVYSTAATPTPAQLATVVQEARQAGLIVSLRPLLDEANLNGSRTWYRPSDRAEFFASYQRFLLPYAAMAQQQHVPEFFAGAELEKLSHASQWARLDSALRARFSGTLACSDNWSRIARACAVKAQTVDAYQPIKGRLLPGWLAYDRALPAHQVIAEMDITAVAGAQAAPFVHTVSASRKIDQAVQVSWFNAACSAAIRTHLGGIYFWSVGLTTSPGRGPTLSDPLAWAGGKGALAISDCFERISR